MEEIIKKDIETIEKVLLSEDNNKAEELQGKLIPKYKSKIPSIYDGLNRVSSTIISTMYPKANVSEVDYLRNLEIIKGRLEILLAEEREQRNQQVPFVNFNNYNNNNSSSDSHANDTLSNTNSNTNTVDVGSLFESARKEIEKDKSLDTKYIQDILEKINELEALYNSSDTSTDKWKNAKEILGWIADKGVKVAKVVLPLITEAIK